MADEKLPIKVETTPGDWRFPSANQTKRCFTCIEAKGKGEESDDCTKYAKCYRSLCPGEWIERWKEQRANGTFAGPL
uniref:Cytochrome c oxidase subunit n=1 Tax=Leersia perrieri TaxID=77586 RepID=A0A0D9VM13_9ORYZ